MKGDFSRLTFDPVKNFTQVLMQQGRVTVDADANEQTAILLHYLRTLTKDLLGPFSAPRVGGLKLVVDADPVLGRDLDLSRLRVSAGRIYVDGILVEVRDPEPEGGKPGRWSYVSQPYLPEPVAEHDILFAEARQPTGNQFLLYLDVWERLISNIQDDSIREKALGGPDTAVRAQVVWQLKAKTLASKEMTANDKRALAALKRQRKSIARQLETAPEDEIQGLKNQLEDIDEAIDRSEDTRIDCKEALEGLVRLSPGLMAARVDPRPADDSPCVVPPDSKYRGAENQLYRVEIHDGGKPSDPQGVATFKWSRDNGSVATRWLGKKGDDLAVVSSRGFSAGNWVELSHDDLDLTGQPGVLVRLAKVEPGTLTVDPGTAVTWDAKFANPKVRRWDQVPAGDIVLKDGAVPLTESDNAWIDLEDGVQVRFPDGGEYRSGDYWVFPARVAGGSIEWPEVSSGTPEEIPPHGVEHHYASLGMLTVENGKWDLDACGCGFDSITECVEEEPEVPS